MSRLQNWLNEDKNTDYMETASCIGVFVNQSFINKVNIFFDMAEGDDEIKSEIQEILSQSRDWNPVGKSEVLSSIENKKKLIDVISLIRGMYNFVNDNAKSVISPGKLNIIHNKINGYYELEKQIMGEIKGSKANTADCLICNCDFSKLKSNMQKYEVKPNEQGGYITCGDVKFFQVSLKKSKNKAQLGKVTKKLTDLGYVDDGFINEWKALEWFKKISSSVLNKVSSMVKKITGPVLKRIKKYFNTGITKKDLRQLTRGLTESINENKIVNLDKIESDKQKQTVVSILNNTNTILRRINELVNEISSYNSDSIVIKSKLLNTIKDNNHANTALKLASNFKTLNTIKNILDDSEGLSESLRSILAEMFFGSTKLPIWKVYGDFGSGISYSYMGTIERYLTTNMPNNLESIGVRISPDKSGSYYTITILILEDISEKGKNYVKLRTGTNSSSRFSFILEGTSELSIPIDTSLREKI